MKNIKTRIIISSLIACSTLFSALSQAEPPGGPRWADHNGEHAAGHHDDRRHDNHDDRQHDNHDEHRGPAGHHSADRFAWRGHDFRRGQPIPSDFRGPHYRVDNWRERGLYAPPRGEHWAFIDGNYVLVAAATGIITAILLNGAFD